MEVRRLLLLHKRQVVLLLGVAALNGVVHPPGVAKAPETRHPGVVHPPGVVKVLEPHQHGAEIQRGVTSQAGVVHPHGRPEVKPMARPLLGVVAVTNLLTVVHQPGAVTTILIMVDPLLGETAAQHSRAIIRPGAALNKRLVISQPGVIKVTDPVTETAVHGVPEKLHINNN